MAYTVSTSNHFRPLLHPLHQYYFTVPNEKVFEAVQKVFFNSYCHNCKHRYKMLTGDCGLEHCSKFDEGTENE